MHTPELLKTRTTEKWLDDYPRYGHLLQVQNPLEQKDRGRDKKFCSTPCRRAAEYERKRLQNALETVEGRIAWERKRPAEIHPMRVVIEGAPKSGRFAYGRHLITSTRSPNEGGGSEGTLNCTR
jgi:hypothetical protein